MKKKVSLVIPCYNSEKSLYEIVEQASRCLEENEEYDFEIILVNDGSKDKTWGIIKRCSNDFESVKGINLSKNFGQHNALMAAYNNVTGDIIVGIDDDGEQDPWDMFKLIEKLEKGGYDYVCASHQTVKRESVFRNAGTRINGMMAELLIDKPRDFEFNSYYCMRRYLVDEIIKNNNPYPYIMGLILQRSRNFATVELPVHRRKYGSSGYNLRKLLKLWLNGFTAFSVRPLRVASVMGVCTALFGIVFGIGLIIKKMINPEAVMMGYSSLMAIVLFVGGVIMMILGMIGEYIGRIYMNINSSPQFVIREIVGK